MVWITRVLRRVGKVRSTTPKVQKQSKPKKKQGRAKKRHAYNKRAHANKIKELKIMSSPFPKNLPIRPFDTYTKINDGVSWCHFPRFFKDAWYRHDCPPRWDRQDQIKPSNTLCHILLTKGDVIQTEKLQASIMRMQYEQKGDCILKDEGHEWPKINKPNKGMWKYRRTVKRMPHVLDGTMDLGEFLNLGNNMVGVGGRQTLPYLSTIVEWNNTIENVNKPSSN